MVSNNGQKKEEGMFLVICFFFVVVFLMTGLSLEYISSSGTPLSNEISRKAKIE